MNIKHINKTIFPNGGTSDIISVVMMAYDIENDDQIKELAHKLQGSTEYETCKNIWQYLIDTIQYRADVGMQQIKSPARLIYDRVGDCKSYSLLTAVILRYLGIQHVFRFVSYDKRKEATHVYVVVSPSKGDERSGGVIIIDAVATVQANQPFNSELKYTFHCDMANSGTKIAYLAGLPGYGKQALSSKSIGDVSVPSQGKERYKVWIGEETESAVTPGKHYLYARFDLALEMVNISKTDKECAYHFDELDIISSLIHSYNHVDGNCKEFRKMAFIICGMIADGDFYSPVVDENERADRLDDLFLIIDERYHNGYYPERYDRATWDVITHQIYAQNIIEGNSISGIGATESELISKIKESGIYYIYMFIKPGELASFPTVVREKLIRQQKTFAWMEDVNTFQNSATMQLSIRAGIVARTGKTPEQYIADLKSGKATQVAIGEPLSITLAVIGIITGLVSLFKILFPKKTTQPGDKEIAAGAFDPNNDFGAGGTGNGSSASLSSMALPLAVGGAVLFGMFKNNKS